MTASADPSVCRVRELLTGPLTVEALEETSSILRLWTEQGRPQAFAQASREIGALLGGAGRWIEGWQACVEELLARRASDTPADTYDAAGRLAS